MEESAEPWETTCTGMRDHASVRAPEDYPHNKYRGRKTKCLIYAINQFRGRAIGGRVQICSEAPRNPNTTSSQRSWHPRLSTSHHTAAIPPPRRYFCARAGDSRGDCLYPWRIPHNSPCAGAHLDTSSGARFLFAGAALILTLSPCSSRSSHDERTPELSCVSVKCRVCQSLAQADLQAAVKAHYDTASSWASEQLNTPFRAARLTRSTPGTSPASASSS